MFTLFEESVKYHIFCVKALRYNKTETDISIIIENFFFSVRNKLPSIFNLRQHIRNFRLKIVNDLHASHYVYYYATEAHILELQLQTMNFLFISSRGFVK